MTVVGLSWTTKQGSERGEREGEVGGWEGGRRQAEGGGEKGEEGGGLADQDIRTKVWMLI